MRKFSLILSVLLITCVSAQADLVPNGDFETLYKPGTGIPGVVSSGGWTQGVGPECPIEEGEYQFDDMTVGDIADIAGWLGYDRDGWVALGGYQDRDQTTGNLQGCVAAQGNHTEGLPEGVGQQYSVNGSSWGNNVAGALITSAAPLALPDLPAGFVYELSMFANRAGGTGALPIVLDLLVDGVVQTPISAVDPELSGEWQKFSRTYDPLSLPAVGDVTVVLGVGRNATGTQSRFDDVSLDAVPEPATMLLLGLGGLVLLRSKRR